ncbi:MAG: tetratricopeptide repeat protein [Ignavibacteriae bacterium]|nr:tetratricopeptide repeat protein [Ignavibacteriota bacterium]
MTKAHYFGLYKIAAIICISYSSLFGQQSSELLQKEAERHFQAGRFGEAINMLNEIIEQNSQSFDAYVLRAHCYEKRSQLKFSVEDLRKAVKIKPSEYSVNNELIEIEKKWNLEIDNDISKLEKELSVRPNNFNKLPILAELYVDKGNIEKSLLLYRKYIDSSEPSTQIIIRYGELLAQSNKIKLGEKEFEEFSKKYPYDEKINLKYGYFNLWLGNFNKAETIFTQILKNNPNLKDAQDGFKQSKSKGYFGSQNISSQQIAKTKNVNVTDNKIENYKSKLIANSKDYKTRLEMADELIKVKRYEEAFDQFQIVVSDTIAIPKFSIYRKALIEKRDSVFSLITEDYKSKLSINPRQKELTSRLADYYAMMNDYKNARQVLSNYFNLSDVEDGDDLRFRYAKYSSWQGEFEEASNQLDYLLLQDPANLKYQEFKAQILVWSNSHLDLAERYLENNIKAGNQSIEVILSMATLYIQNNHITNAEKYIEWAKSIDPQNKELKNVEKLYIEYQKTLNEKIIYSLIEDGRKFAQKGEFENAILKFEEYFSATNPTESELLEYADLQFRVNNIKKSIEVYDNILKDHYSYDVAKLKAKNILWNKNYKEAISDFQKLSIQNPDDYECKVLLGDAYQNLKQFNMANSIYTEVLQNTNEEKILKMISDRMEFMPQTGFTSLFSDFPSPIGFAPSVIHYSDNQDFSLNNIGGRLEVGIAKILYGGVSYSDINLFSSILKRKFVTFKGNLFLKIFEELQLSGSIGAINSLYQPRRSTSTAMLTFGDNIIYSTQINFEHSDAALVLNSPYLLEIRKNVNIYKFSGFFEPSKKLRLSGYFQYITITDGNVGNDFKLRVGSQLLDETFFGYESRYTNYKYDSPFVPYSNMTQRLYYSPQNLDTHSLWAEWKHDQTNNLKITLGAEIGYIPNYNTILREIEGKIDYNPYSRLILNLEVTVGSSYRYSSSYNYFSGALTLFWRVY